MSIGEEALDRCARTIAESTLAAAFLAANPDRYVKIENEFTLRFEKVIDTARLSMDVADYLAGKDMRRLK